MKSSATLRAYCEKDRTIRLEDVEGEVFLCYLEWLYTGNTDLLNAPSVATDDAIIRLTSTEQR